MEFKLKLTLQNLIVNSSDETYTINSTDDTMNKTETSRIRSFNLTQPLQTDKRYLIVYDVLSITDGHTIGTYFKNSEGSFQYSVANMKTTGRQIITITPKVEASVFAIYFDKSTTEEEKVATFKNPAIFEYREGMEKWIDEVNSFVIPNSDILDKIEFITDMGTSDFTLGKLIVPTIKTKIHNDVEIKIGDIFTVYIDGTKYGTYEPYELKQQNLYREVTLYSMPYFALTKTFQPSTTNYTTRSLLLEMQTTIGFNVVGFQDIVAIDMNNVKSDTGINLLQAIAMLLGTNITINPHGEIVFTDITTSTVYEISSSNITAITKSDTTDYLITRIIGKLSDSDENPIIAGTQANAFNDLTLVNPYLTSAICTSILSKLPNYTGFDLTIFNAPLLKPLDKVKFTYKGTEYTIPVMNMTITFGNSGLVAKVQSCVSNANDKSSNYKGSLTTKLEVIQNVTSELNTKVEVVDGRVSSLITKTDAIEGEQTTIKNQYSQINQTIGEIDLRVGQVQTELGDKVSTDEIITSINLSNEGVKIQGDKVVLTGDTIIIGANGEQTLTQFIKDEGENLLLKPNFNDGTLTDWGYSVSSYIFVDTTYKHNDNTACKLQYTGTSNAVMLSTTSMSIDKFESGKTYKMSMYIYVEDKTTLTNTMYLRANGMPSGVSSRVVIAERTITSANLTNNQWTELSLEFTPTQDYTSPQLIINVTGGISAWVTDFSVQVAGGLSQTEMVKILNGAGDGLYLVDGELLINAEYIQTGTVRADLVKVQVDDTSNLLPFNYITMDNAINGEFYINEDSNGYPFAECDLPIYNGGGDNDTLCTPFGYSNINIEQGKSYWFSCEYYAQWNNDTKPDDGVGTSTIGGGNKTGIGTKTGNNLDLFLFNGTDTSKINYGRNLLDNTDGRSLPKIFSVDTPFVSGFSATASPESSYEYGHLMLTASGNQEVEHFYRFMLPIHTNLYELEQGCTYVLSGLICGTMSEIAIRHEYSSNGGTWIGDTQYNIPIASTDEWQSFTYTFTVPSDATGFYLSFQDYNRETGTICYLAHLKLEKSEVATPWCLSPYDSTGTNPSYVEQSNPVMILASVLDFNESINIVERENYEGVYQRGWTRLVGRIDAKFSYEGNLWINIDGSGFEVGDQGWFYLKNLQLMDASENDEAIELDYIQQLKEKRIELTDGSYYTNLVGVDGIKLTEGVISGKSNTSQREFELNYDGLEFKSTTGSENAFLGLGQAQYSYDGGSSGTIYGYDELYGVGTRYLIEDTGDYEGIFIGVHKGFQIPNSTAYGRPDIYVRNRYSDRLDFTDWTDYSLLGEKVEPLGLVRRDENCNITTKNCLVVQESTDTGGETWHGTTVFSEAMYNAVGNGQLINTNTDTNRIYIGNPNSILFLESAYGLTVNEAGTQKQVLTNGIQYGDIQTNIYTGNSIDIWADRDYSSTTERVWIGAGGNGLTITSSGTGQNVDAMKFNGHIVINTSNLHDKIYIGAQDSTETGRDIKDWGVHSYNLYNKSLTNGDGTSSAYGGYWSVLTFGNGTSGSAQLAIDWTASGRGFYMRSLRDTGDNWWTWKRIGNSEWLLDSTSDERYKRAISDVSTEDCYNMVKNIELHSYLLLTEEERHRVEKGELDVDELFLRTTTSEGIHHNLQMGVLAQDMLKYSCGTYVVNQDILRDENGELISDRYGIDAYNYASAILGGLQEEIKVRDEQYEELKKENEDLKAKNQELEERVARLEELLLKE